MGLVFSDMTSGIHALRFEVLAEDEWEAKLNAMLVDKA